MGHWQSILENMGMNISFWKNRNVFLTGHTGFKGGWTSLWLSSLGANVFGYSLAPSTNPNFFSLTRLKEQLSQSTFANILDMKKLSKAMKASNPSLIIHMAAQPIVRESYKKPIETIMNNVIGTANVFEASRQIKTVKAIINITTDKCYEIQKGSKAYTENDQLGGHDPYSSSKACSELITSSYRKSFFSNTNVHLASVRAGNIIGGGDWAKDRLIPDFFRALNKKKSLIVRSPNSIRPWQHVLEPIFGYLLLAEKLIKSGKKYAEAWNFGPKERDNKEVFQIVKYLSKNIKGSSFEIINSIQPYETKILKLNSNKARTKLKWSNHWDINTTLDKTIEWYKAWQNNQDMKSFSISQIKSYEKQIYKLKT